MKIAGTLLLVFISVFCLNCHAPQKIQASKLWLSLFNGKDIADWMANCSAAVLLPCKAKATRSISGT